MKIQLDIEECGDWERVNLEVKNGTCVYETFDLMKHDELEDLENRLIEITTKLNNYRRKEQNNES